MPGNSGKIEKTNREIAIREAMELLEKIFGEKPFKLFRNEEEGYRLEIPTDWRLVSVTEAYGHSFSEGTGGAGGMLSVKPVILPGVHLQDYYDALVEGVKKELKYKFFASTDTRMANRPAKEVVFLAYAYVNGKRKKAIVTTAIVDDSEHYRFLVLTFMALSNEYEHIIGIFNHSKKTLSIN